MCVLELLTGSQIRAARGFLDWSQTMLAKKSKVALGTIRRLESTSDKNIICTTPTMEKVCDALTKGGVTFMSSPTPGVMLSNGAK